MKAQSERKSKYPGGGVALAADLDGTRRAREDGASHSAEKEPLYDGSIIVSDKDAFGGDPVGVLRNSAARVAVEEGRNDA